MANDIGLNISLDTKQAQQSAEGLTASLGSLGASFARMSAIIGGFTALSTIANQFSAAVTSAIEFEEQIADIRKVTSRGVAEDLSIELQRLAEEIPIARDELASIVEEAGRLGIQGKENIRDFTEAVSQLAVATNLSAEDASRSFARILTVTGTATQQIDNLGSSVNELSNNMATSADEIVDGMARASATASQFGLSADEIAAVSASINEVSATARRANTRLRRLFQELQSPKKIEEVANALNGISEEGFQEMSENNPQQLLVELVRQFRQGGQAADRLRQSLGSASRQAVAGLAQNLDGLNRALNMSQSQFEENTSLQREFAIQAGTTASKLQVMRNNAENLRTEMGQELLPTMNLLREATVGWLNAINEGVFGLTELNRQFQQTFGAERANRVSELLTRFQEGPGRGGLGLSGDQSRKLQSRLIGAIRAVPGEFQTQVAQSLEAGIQKATESSEVEQSAESVWNFLREKVIDPWAPRLAQATKDGINQGFTESDIQVIQQRASFIQQSLAQQSVEAAQTFENQFDSTLQTVRKNVSEGLIDRETGLQRIDEFFAKFEQKAQQSGQKAGQEMMEQFDNALSLVQQVQTLQDFDFSNLQDLPNSIEAAANVSKDFSFGIGALRQLSEENIIESLASQPAKTRKKVLQVASAIQQTVDESKDPLTQFEKNVRRASEGAARSFEDTFVKAMQGGFDSVEDALRSFGQSFVKELQRIVASNAAQQLFGTKKTEGGGLKQTGLINQGISSLAGGIGDFFNVGDALVKENGDVVNFDDRDNLLAFRRNGPLMQDGGAGQQQQSQGGAKVVNQEINVTTGVQQTVRAEIKRMMPQIQKAALEGVKESADRGGSTSQRLGA